MKSDQDGLIVCWRIPNEIRLTPTEFAEIVGPEFSTGVKPVTTKKLLIRAIRALQIDAKPRNILIQKIQDERRKPSIWRVIKMGEEPKLINRIHYSKSEETVSFDDDNKYPAKTLSRLLEAERGVTKQDMQRFLASIFRPKSFPPLRGNGGVYLIPDDMLSVVFHLETALQKVDPNAKVFVFDSKRRARSNLKFKAQAA